jgi:hypothetical protein
MKIAGARWAGKIRPFDYSIELASEQGTLASDRIDAWAGHWLAGYSVPSRVGPIRFYQEFNYASGDANPHDGHRQTFDQLYPSGHDKLGATDLFGWKNIQHLRSGIEWQPNKKWMASARWNEYWLASSHDALYSGQSAVVAIRADGSAARRVGEELDLVGTYKLTKFAQTGAGYGRLFPGTFLRETTPGHDYSLAYMFLGTQF